MASIFRKEFLNWIIMLSPLIYLGMVWEQLPEEVPIHFNAVGEADNYGSKMSLFWLSFLLPVGVYALLTLVGRIDPKQNLHKMGEKFSTFKIFLVSFMAIISFFVIQSGISGSVNPKWLYGLVSLLFVFLGNYLQSVPSNYFIGIRTPWTLENESVWKKTHRFGGRIMMGLGVVMFCLCLILEPQIFAYFLIGGALLTALIPAVYSYLEFQKLKEVG